MKSIVIILSFVSVAFAQKIEIDKSKDIVQKPPIGLSSVSDTAVKAKVDLIPKVQLQESHPLVHDQVFYSPDELVYSLKSKVFACVDKQFIFLSWAAVKEAKGFNIYRKKPGDTKYVKINKKILTWPTDQSAAVNLYNKLMPHTKYVMDRSHIKTAIDSVIVRKQKQVPPEFVPQFVNLSDYAKQAYYDIGAVYYQIAIIIGYGYADSSVVSGQVYNYKVKYLKEDNTEVELDGITIKAGVEKKLTKPAGLKAEAGDSEILLVWNDPPPTDTIAGYHVFKSTSKTGPFKRCNPVPVVVKRTFNLKGDTLNPPQYAYQDTLVNNYTTYYYKVTSRNHLDQISPMSDVAHTTPTDLTPPLIPEKIRINPSSKDSLLISWNLVTRDTLFRSESVKGYHVYKYTDYNTAVSPKTKHSKYHIGFVPEPTLPPGVFFIIGVERDTCIYDGGVEPEKVYWYRVSCEDTSGNVGQKSAAVYAILPDIEPPDPPLKNSVTADGFDKHIQIWWKPPDISTPEKKKKNKDLAGFKIYRGICGGEYSIREQIYHPYPLHLLADINDKTDTTYLDYSVPKGSPICYRYALKAYDKAQNLSVMSDSVCARLKDTTPPDQPVVTALQARDRAIKIECAAAPIQDMKGFVVERSDIKDGIYKEVYCDPVPVSVTCDDIPVKVDSVLARKAHILSFEDKTVDPEKIYWYRVRAFDYNNNRSKPSPPVSTYTYEIVILSKPVNVKVNLKKQINGCSVNLTWGPDISKYPKTFIGFAVYRSFSKDSGYRQISSLIKDTQFKDTAIAPGMTCWYKVQAFDSNGDRSPVSNAVNVTIVN